MMCSALSFLMVCLSRVTHALNFFTSAYTMETSRLAENVNLALDKNTETLVTDYVINVKTSDRFGAGTDADVFVRLLGDRDPEGCLEPLALKHSQNLNKFERNSFDQFTLCDQISRGKLEKIKIWHDDTGLGASWHLEFVEVCDIRAQLMYRFPCHRWLSSTEDDKQICRTLRCTEISIGPKQTVQIATGTPKPGVSITNRFKKSSLNSLISRPGSSHNNKRTDSAPTLTDQNFPDDSSSTLDCGNEQEQSDMVTKLRELDSNNRQGGCDAGKFSFIEPSSNKIEVFSARPSTVYGQFSFGRGPRQESAAEVVGAKAVDRNMIGRKQNSKSSLYGPFSSR
uniref:PLAT domain-containing protein n=1 Tax=Romanomermis culicivorax TaxID=13658 RepID=A0A915ID05_ROMCU